MASEIKASTRIMRYISYAILVLIIVAGIGAMLSGNSGSSSVPVAEEPMF